jgi:ligand-binding SRPBCC domain-containing protein
MQVICTICLGLTILKSCIFLEIYINLGIGWIFFSRTTHLQAFTATIIIWMDLINDILTLIQCTKLYKLMILIRIFFLLTWICYVILNSVIYRYYLYTGMA